MSEQSYRPVLEMDAFDYLSLVLSVLVIALHAYGIRLLVALKNSMGPRHVFIANFSMWNIFWAVTNLVRYPLQRCLHGELYVYWILGTEGARIPFYLAILYITIDRFLQLFLHLSYCECFFSKHKVALSVLAFVLYIAWLAVVIPLFVERKLSLSFLIRCTSLYISGAFHVAIFLIFLTVYSYIGHKLLVANTQIGQRRASLRKLAVPCIIVITFILLETLPDCFIFFGMARYGGWTIFLFRVDALSNALVYIFLQPKIKNSVSNRVRKRSNFRSNNTINDNKDITAMTSYGSSNLGIEIEEE